KKQRLAIGAQTFRQALAEWNRRGVRMHLIFLRSSRASQRFFMTHSLRGRGWRRSMTRFIGFRDQARAALAGEIRPQPLTLHAQAILQLRQREDVNERPHQIRQEAAGAQPTSLQHRVILADDGHVALVEIAEWALYLASLQLFRDKPPDVFS